MSSKTLFATLLKDTLLFFQQEGYQCPSPPPSTPSKVSSKNEVKAPVFKEVVVEKEVIEKKEEKETKAPIKEEKLPSLTNWQLVPLPTSRENKSFSLQFGKFFSLQKLDIPVKLILPSELEEERLFLENVSRAITKNFAPASVQLFEEFDWEAKYVLAPLSILKKKFPEIEGAHQITQKNGITFLAMEELSHYLAHRNLKLNLWQTIKTILQKLSS